MQNALGWPVQVHVSAMQGTLSSSPFSNAHGSSFQFAHSFQVLVCTRREGKSMMIQNNINNTPHPTRCARVDVPRTGLYEQSFGLSPSASYSVSSFRSCPTNPNRCTRVDFHPTGLYEQSFCLISSASYSVTSFRS